MNKHRFPGALNFGRVQEETVFSGRTCLWRRGAFVGVVHDRICIRTLAKGNGVWGGSSHFGLIRLDLFTLATAIFLGAKDFLEELHGFKKM